MYYYEFDCHFYDLDPPKKIPIIELRYMISILINVAVDSDLVNDDWEYTSTDSVQGILCRIDTSFLYFFIFWLLAKGNSFKTIYVIETYPCTGNVQTLLIAAYILK